MDQSARVLVKPCQGYSPSHFEKWKWPWEPGRSVAALLHLCYRSVTALLLLPYYSVAALLLLSITAHCFCFVPAVVQISYYSAIACSVTALLLVWY